MYTNLNKNLNKKINIYYNINSIHYYLLYKLKNKYLLKSKFCFFDKIKTGNIIFVEVFNYEFYSLRKYFFLGLCVGIKKNKINTRFILRNVLGNTMVEQQFLIFNSLILNLRKSKKRIVDVGYKKSKLFFLKNLPFFFRINKLVVNETFFYSNRKIKKNRKKKWKFF